MRPHSSVPIQFGLIAILAGTGFMLFMGAFVWLGDASANMQLDAPVRDYLLGLAWSLIILATIPVWPIPQSHRMIMLVLWLARIGVTLGFMLFYEGYYGLDATSYFHDGILEPSPFGLLATASDGTHRVIALVGIHNLLIPGSYHAMKVTWALCGLLAVYLFYRSACLFVGRDDVRILCILGLFPSILFWGSILGKDPVTMLGIALYSLGVIGCQLRRRSGYILVLAAGMLLAAFMRVWLSAILLFPLGLLLIFGRRGLMRWVLLLTLVPASLIATQQVQKRFAIETTEDIAMSAEQVSQGWATGGSAQIIEGGFPNFGEMLLFIPKGVFAALFRPLPGEVMNPFGLLASAENLFLLSLLWLSIWRGRWPRMFGEPLLFWAAMLVITWAGIYGFVSYQNLGTAFRFKAQIMPILLLLLLYLGLRKNSRVIPGRKEYPETVLR